MPFSIGTSIQHSAIRDLFGDGSPELKAAQLADQCEYRDGLRTAPSAADSERLRYDRYRRAQRLNGSFESEEARVMNDPAFDPALRGPLERVVTLITRRQPFEYKPVKVADRASLLRTQRQVTEWAASLPTASFAGSGLEAAINELVVYQQQAGGAAEPLLRETVERFRTSSIFDTAHPGAIEKIASRFLATSVVTEGGDVDVAREVLTQPNLTVTAHLHNNDVPPFLASWPFVAQTIAFELRTVPHAIVVIDRGGGDFYPAGPMTSASTLPQRADANGVIRLAGDAGKVRVLDPNTLQLIGCLSLEEQPLTLRFPDRADPGAMPRQLRSSPARTMPGVRVI